MEGHTVETGSAKFQSEVAKIRVGKDGHLGNWEESQQRDSTDDV